jgi:hypothetical protein
LTLPADVGPIVRPLGQFLIEAIEGGTRVVGYRS